MTAIKIFDTTLRDGEQAPGFSMSTAGKLRVARRLADLKVDIIEAGFAAASPGDAESIKHVAAEIEGPTIASLARATPGDVKAAGKALRGAKRSRMHVFLGTSPLHREAKLGMSQTEVLNAIAAMVALARDQVDEVEFSAEDAIRTERDFLVEALSTAAEAGADVLNVPDTVGFTTPDEIYDLFKMLDSKVSRDDHVIFSAHCHNDLGLAVANSLAAVRGGARQVECTLNGIGERAGNCALEEVVMALHTRRDVFGIDTGLDTSKLMDASRTLAQATKTHLPRNKAVVGSNAFAHEAGIHQHGVLKNRETYEIMRAEDVGQKPAHLVLGKHSGKHALKARAESLGYELDEAALGNAFDKFKNLADEIGIVDEARLCTLLDGLQSGQAANLWKLGRLDIKNSLSPQGKPSARVEMSHEARGRVTDIAFGQGELDAAFRAVGEIMGIDGHVDSLDLQYMAAEAQGPDAQPAAQTADDDSQGAKVLVQIEVLVSGERYDGRAVGRDIIPVCVSAYIDALNNAVALRNRLGLDIPEPASNQVASGR